MSDPCITCLRHILDDATESIVAPMLCRLCAKVRIKELEAKLEAHMQRVVMVNRKLRGERGQYYDPKLDPYDVLEGEVAYALEAMADDQKRIEKLDTKVVFLKATIEWLMKHPGQADPERLQRVLDALESK